MANKNVKEFRKIYNRKILRSMLKHQLKTNKIQGAWHRLMGTEIVKKGR